MPGRRRVVTSSSSRRKVTSTTSMVTLAALMGMAILAVFIDDVRPSMQQGLKNLIGQSKVKQEELKSTLRRVQQKNDTRVVSAIIKDTLLSAAGQMADYGSNSREDTIMINTKRDETLKLLIPDGSIETTTTDGTFMATGVSHRLRSYSHDDIVEAMQYFHTWYLRLLVWDGKHFTTYAVGHNSTNLYPEYKTSARLTKIIPLLVHSLKSNFPDRFDRKKKTPVFELLFSEADTLNINCGLNDMEPCPLNLPPILAFGSVYKDQSILPSVKVMPAPGRWCDCLYKYRMEGQDTCPLHHLVHDDLSYEDLTPQLVWRGADWPFLPGVKEYEPLALRELMWKVPIQWKEETREEILAHMHDKINDITFPPRWKAALWTMEADVATAKSDSNRLPWIDSRFVGGASKDFRIELMQRGLHVNGERIEEKEMSKYRYQIDFGGGGGTSWEGTLQKLLSPGLLFHHETPTKDFFYDDMQPWVHYVPVDTNLGNLREQFEWAKAHPEEAQRIAQQGTDFAHYMLSKEYMDKKYKELFVDYLGDLVNAFDPSEKVRYPLDMQVHEISKCTKHGMCRTQVADGKYQSVRFEPK